MALFLGCSKKAGWDDPYAAPSAVALAPALAALGLPRVAIMAMVLAGFLISRGSEKLLFPKLADA